MGDLLDVGAEDSLVVHRLGLLRRRDARVLPEGVEGQGVVGGDGNRVFCGDLYVSGRVDAHEEQS